MTAAIRQERGIGVEHGALIYNIGPDAAGGTGLRPGDVIFQINRQAIAGADDLRRAFAQAVGRGPVTVWFERSGGVGRTTFYVQ